MESIKKLQGLIATVIFVAGSVTLVLNYGYLPGKVTELEDKIVKLEKVISKQEDKIELNSKRIEAEVLNSGVEDIFKN